MLRLHHSRRDRSRVPPIGQGLAVVASVAAIAVISIGGIVGYLLSLHIASWGNEGKALDAQLHAKRQEVQRLRNELDFRSRFPELTRWSDTLGLRPTEGAQYVTNVHQLGPAANARRTALEDDTCGAAPPLKPACPPDMVGGKRGYTPKARQQMDSLIGDIAN